MRTPSHIARICLNGHVLNADAPRQSTGRDYCAKCGEFSIIACQHCEAHIPGRRYDPTGYYNYYARPAHCTACGKPYPWTERRLRSAEKLISESNLGEHEKQEFIQSLPALARDSIEAEESAGRIKRFLGQLRDEAKPVITKLIHEIASETAKKMIFGS